jgi:oligoendopeptidase F
MEGDPVEDRSDDPALALPRRDANASGGGFGDLPDWDLSDLYSGPDAPEFARDMAWLERACAGFAAL